MLMLSDFACFVLGLQFFFFFSFFLSLPGLRLWTVQQVMFGATTKKKKKKSEEQEMSDT